MLYQPEGGGPLHLFYADGNACHWAGKKDWRAGGDIKVTSTSDMRKWAAPRTVFSEASEGLMYPEPPKPETLNTLRG